MIDDATKSKDEQTSGSDLKAVHERAMRRFDECALPTQECRELSFKARRFASIPGAQWEDEWGEQFANAVKLEVNKIGRGIDKIETDYRQNRIVPDFRPDGGQGDEETAELLDGLHRADNYRCDGDQSRENAFLEAASGGFGAYRLLNEMEDEYDPDNDNQRINPAEIITDADMSVFFDINAKKYDKRDAGYCFVRTAMSMEAFVLEYGQDAATEFPDGLDNIKTDDWYSPDTVAIAEYYEVEIVEESYFKFTHGISGHEFGRWEDQLEEDEQAKLVTDGYTVTEQLRQRRRIHKYVLSGGEVLDDVGFIAGTLLPIIPVYGKRYFVDRVEWWKGYTQDHMDAQRLYNSQVSRIAENNAQAPRDMPIFDPEQIDQSMADQWADSNINRPPFLMAKALRNPDGAIAHIGPIGHVKPSEVSPAQATLLQIADQDLREEMQDGSDTVKANTSADAMELAATRVDAKSGIYLDNMRKSVRREGEVYLEMSKEIYADKGRVVETMSEDGGDGTAELMQNVTRDDGTNTTINDLASGRYKVISSVGEATATRRDKTVRQMLNIADVAGQIQDIETAQAAIGVASVNMDGEGIGDFKEYMRQRGIRAGYIKPNEDEQKRMAEEAENAEPAPMDALAQAEAQKARAAAALSEAKVAETEQNTVLKEAQTVETLVNAEKAAREYVKPPSIPA